VWEALKKNQNDPDFAAAFAKALGPKAAGLVTEKLTLSSWRSRRQPVAMQPRQTAG
jgi:hypothetical protein